MEKEETGQSHEELNLLRRRVAELEQAEAKSRQIEEKLRLERDFNATLIQAAPLFFVAIAADGRTLMMNKAMLQSLGYTAAEVVDRDYLMTFVPARGREALSWVFATLTTSHEPTLNKNRVLTKAGRELLVEWHGRQVFKEDGALDFFFGAGVDITERVQTEALYQAIGNPTLILDLEHNIISANRAAAKVTGQPEEKLVGKKCYEVLHNTDEPPEGCPLVKMLASSRMETAEMEIEALGLIYLVSCTPVLDERGQLEKIIHVATDITEDKHAERRMEHLALGLRAIRNVNQLIVHEKDRDTLIQRACDLLIEARGYYNAWIALFDESGMLVTSANAGLRKEFTPLIEKLKHGELTACGQRALAQSGVVATEGPPLACADCPLAMSYAGRGALAVRLEHGGKVYGVLSASIPREDIADEEEQGLFNEVAGDIAFALYNIESEEEHARTEKKLVLSETRFRELFEHMSTGVAVYETHNNGDDFVIVDFNPAAEQIDDVKREKIIGKSVLEVFPEIKEFGLFDIFKRVWKTGKPEYHPISMYKDERIFGWRENYVYKLPSGEIVAAYDDITKQKQAREEIRKLNWFQESIIDNANVWLDVLDERGNVVVWNKAAEVISGYSRDEVVGHEKIWEWLYPDDEYRCELTAKLTEIIEKDMVLENFETTICCKNGVPKVISWNSRNLLDENGNSIGSSALGRDITERKQTEEALRKSEAQYRLLAENTRDCIWQMDGVMTFTYVNPAILPMLGFTPKEWIGTALSDHCSTAETQKVMALIVGEMRKGKNYTATFEMSLFHKEGRSICVEVNGTILVDEKGELVGYQGTTRDITERKRAEEEKRALEAQLRQGQKLESIGTLASGVAHEINNPLMGMINYADLIESRIEDAQLKQFAQGIIKEGNRVAEIVKNLLYFARQEKQSHSLARMEDIIDASLALIGAVLRKDQIVIEKKIVPGLPKVRCRSQQIEQVIINLLTNARDALNERYLGYHENKIIVIQAQPFEKDGVEWVRTTIEDHGNGISEEIIARVFDPFFTTKPRDVGTGLGLSVSYGIVRDHHGELSVESKLGEYTRFHIDLRVNNE